MSTTTRRVVLHPRPHLDEYFALMLARTYGEKLFPGIREASFSYVDAGQRPRTPADQLEQRGILYLGLGGGRFDEHPAPGADTSRSTSCAQLMAEVLEVADRPRVKELLAYANASDTRGDRDGPLGLGRLVNQVNARFINEPERATRTVLRVLQALLEYPEDAPARPELLDHIVALQLVRHYRGRHELELPQLATVMAQAGHPPSWTQHVRRQFQLEHNPELDLIAKYLDQPTDGNPYGLQQLTQRVAAHCQALYDTEADAVEMTVSTVIDLVAATIHDAYQFTVVARDELASERARTETFQVGSRSGDRQLLVIQTDNERVKARAFSRIGGRYTAVILRDSAGRTQVFANPQSNLDLSRVAAAIRRMENARRPLRERQTPADWSAPGNLPEVPMWFYDPVINMLTNGTFSAPNMPPTRIPLNRIVAVFQQEVRARPKSGGS